MELDDLVTKTCQTKPFALLCDESNNIKQDKGFVILARVLDAGTGMSVEFNV